MKISGTVLKKGINEIKFVFTDNLHHTTSGFAVNDLKLIVK